MNPLVSIITPMFNNDKVIEETIASVINQTYSNYELLLIDDSSSDLTLQKVLPFVRSNDRIQVFQHTDNKGAAEARNLGTKMAKGKYIAFLDADDLWVENKLELQVNILEAGVCDVCFGSYGLIDGNSQPLNKEVVALDSLSYDKLIKANYIGNLTGIYNCETLGKIYTKDLKKRQDWLLWITALKRSKTSAIGIKKIIAFYRISDGSLSSNKFNLIMHNYNLYRVGLGFTFFKSIYHLIVFFFEHLIVKRSLVKTTN
ncbi:MAG: glycosyltransferase family 2 protein [Winogradskyella sp.]|uniref:glycosyltransferase family 2 protein n=1 Tax=Winogradskyella sp. TaxID=1883156 RepID=UPI00180FB215|nr:glycosyltransferase family 2 protein [Winogradskyella sp.]